MGKPGGIRNVCLATAHAELMPYCSTPAGVSLPCLAALKLVFSRRGRVTEAGENFGGATAFNLNRHGMVADFAAISARASRSIVHAR